MEILTFGDSSKRKIMLIHGFQSPWQVWNPYIERYAKDFHILVPVMPGHNPQEQEDFVSFSETARMVEEDVLARWGENIYAVYGMSMGGVLAATLWQRGRLKIGKVIFDGSPLTGVNSLMKRMMLSFYLNITHKAQQRDEKTLKQAAGTIIAREYLPEFLQVLDHMSDATIVNSLNGIAAFRLSGSGAEGTKVYFFHGTAMNEFLARKSARFIAKHDPGASIRCFPGKAHCENALLHPEVMLQELDAILL